MSGNPKSHRRQRSSVTIKKRIIVSNKSSGGNDGDETDVPDNALSSASLTTNGTLESSSLDTPTIISSTEPDGEHGPKPSFRPVHRDHISPGEADQDRLFSSQAPTHQQDSQDYFAMGYRDSAQGQAAARKEDGQLPTPQPPPPPLPREPSPPAMVGDTTTRSELDLFSDDDSSVEGVDNPESNPQPPNDATEVATRTSGDQTLSSSAIAPPPFSDTHSSDVRPQDTAPAASSSSSDRSYMPKTPRVAETESWEDGNAPGSSGKRPTRRLSLLTGVGIVAGGPESPRTSPRALRTAPLMSATSSTGTSTPRSARKASRMSLGYHSTSADPKLGTFASRQVMTPPVAGVSLASFGRPSLDLGSRSMSASTAASNESHASVSAKGGDETDTLVSQHRGLLERIAEKERAILEIRETLAREEDELKALRQKWQDSMAREMAANHSTPSATPTAIARENTKPGVESSSGATDAIKGLSAKLGFGSQINAFLDQLVAVSPNEEQEKEMKRNAPARRAEHSAGLGALTEEEEDEAKRSRAEKVPAVPEKHNTFARKHTGIAKTGTEGKHGSMFGASLAAISKQMESQFGATMTSAPAKEGSTAVHAPAPSAMTSALPTAPAEFGWGSLQKRLKEARDNASGFLAMAEAKLGQAMTIDDFVRLEGPETDGKGQFRTVESSSSNQSRAFTEENDREKAALAELSWLNSLAGVKTSGTVDRVVAVQESPRLNRKAARLNEQNLLELENSDPLACARSSTSSSHSTTRPDAASPSLDRSQITSPTLEGRRPSVSRSSGKHSSVAGLEPERRATGGGFFDVLSAVLAPEKSTAVRKPTTSPTTVKDKRLSAGGQSKTRIAARTALNDANGKAAKTAITSESPRPDHAASSPGQAIDMAWQWDEPTEEESAQQSIIYPGHGIGLYDVDMPVMEPSRSAPQTEANAK